MLSDKIDIIILRGAPGSGKSHTAKSLSGYFPKGVKLEVDVLRQMVISVDWKNQAEHINILNASTGLVYNFLKLGFSPVIVVDTFSGDKFKMYVRDLYQLDQDLKLKMFGLFTNDDELKRRLELRPNQEFRDFGIAKKLNDDVIRMRYDNEHQIDTTSLLPARTAEIIYEQITKI